MRAVSEENTMKVAWQVVCGLTAQTSVLPLRFDVPAWNTLPEAEACWMLQTRSVHECNRIADDLLDEQRQVEQASALIG